MSSSDKSPEDNPDIEDGEITDDDEEAVASELIVESEPDPATAGAQPTIPVIQKPLGNVSDSDSVGAPIKEPGEPTFRERSSDRERSDEKDKFSDGREKDKGKGKNKGRKNRDKGNREDKTHRHMTEAERSILHLRKREKMMREREKWDKHHRKDAADPLDDDFAKNIEKTLATILNKKEKEVAALSAGEEVKDEVEKSGKKRKKENRDKDRSKNKHKRLILDSPRSEIDENEMLNIRSGSPSAEMRLHPPAGAYVSPMDHKRSRSPSEESYNSEYSSDEREERPRRRSMKNRRKKEMRRERRDRDQRRANRDEQSKGPLQDSQGVCVFYMQGKCQKNDCPYSHEVSPPMKLELCKFYLMDCCAKGENCSYMHSEFPCKFYHTGLQCTAGKDCKFAHGRPLSEGLKQILFKHIETAPRDILQGFPRLSRDEALNLINQTQKKLVDQVNNGASELHTSPTSSTSSAAFNTPSSTQPQANYGVPPPSTAGLGMYRDEYADDKDGVKGGIPSLFDITVPVPRELAQGLDFETKMGKNDRHRNKNSSRWQENQEPKMSGRYPVKGFNYGTDQDMRITSNGDVDMRTLPAIPSTTTTSISEKQPSFDTDSYQRDGQQKADIDIRTFTKDVDIRQVPFATTMSSSMDTDIRQKPFEDSHNDSDSNSREDKSQSVAPNFDLPQATRDLLARITATQKDNTVDAPSTADSQHMSSVQSENYDDQNINWYSDDDDDDENRLTIKVEDEETHKRETQDSIDSVSERDTSMQDDQANESMKSTFLSPPQFNSKTAEIVGKLGDLSKIDISDEVTKLLTSMNQHKTLPVPPQTSAKSCSSAASSRAEGRVSPKEDSMPTDPRMTRQARPNPRQDVRSQDPRQDPRLSDPRQRVRQSSTETKEREKKSEKMSIYEQGGIDMKKAALEIDGDDFKSSLRPDIDLRNMSLPFKGMQNYTPATEIDASINSHPPIVWKIFVVEIPRPDYTGLKLSINEAEKTGDPRLRKIFRLSVDEKDSPASPKASPKQSGVARVDPRLRKIEEKIQEPKDSPQMNYNQQLSMLQSSQFYQSLTSNQKLMLNQELARNDQSGGGGLNDPVLNTILSSLNIVPQTQTSQAQTGPNSHIGAAVSILANINKMNSLLPNQPMIGQQGLLGAAPGIPNIPPNLSQGMPPDYPMNFDPRGCPGLLGNAPPGGGFNQFGGMDQPPFGGGYNDDFYGGYDDGPPAGNMGNMGPQGGNFRPGRGYNNNNNRDGRRRGHRDGFRGGRGSGRNFKRGGRDKGDRDRGRIHRGHSPS